jgi:hypothetical protein
LRKHFGTLQHIFYRGLSDVDPKVRKKERKKENTRETSAYCYLRTQCVKNPSLFCVSFVPNSQVRVQSLHALSSLTALAAGDTHLLQTFQPSVVPLTRLLQQSQEPASVRKEKEEKVLVSCLLLFFPFYE